MNGVVAQRSFAVPFGRVCQDVGRGRSVLRSLTDAGLEGLAVIRGRSVDLGGSTSGYLRTLPRSDDVQAVVLDIREEAHPAVVADLERPLPFKDASIETVLLVHVLEHIDACEQLLAEIRRVLKPGGTLYFAVPFLMPVHEFGAGELAYRDYRRWSGAGLGRLLGDFRRAAVVELEVGPLTAGSQMVLYALPFRPLRVVLAAMALIGDRAYARMRRRTSPNRTAFVLGYVGAAEK